MQWTPGVRAIQLALGADDLSRLSQWAMRCEVYLRLSGTARGRPGQLAALADWAEPAPRGSLCGGLDSRDGLAWNGGDADAAMIKPRRSAITSSSNEGCRLFRVSAWGVCLCKPFMKCFTSVADNFLQDEVYSGLVFGHVELRGGCWLNDEVQPCSARL